MASYFVYNRTDPETSEHRAGWLVISTAVDRVKDIIAQYRLVFPSADTDTMEIVPEEAFISYRASTARTVPNLVPVADE